MQSFEDKVAVVTGGASGIGRALAERFAEEGMKVVLSDVEERALRAAEAELLAGGAEVLAVTTDVGSAESMDHLAEATLDRFGAAHVLALNAGVSGGGGPMEDLTTSDWQWAIDVNLYGIIHGLRVFLSGLKAQDEGHVVVTASVAGLTSYPGTGPYNATKHAAVAIAETLHAELDEAGSEVGVSCLCPGMVSTQIYDSGRNRPKELTEDVPSEVTEEQVQMLRQVMGEMFSQGVPPAEVAALVFQAIVRKDFWVYTDGMFEEPIRARHRSIETPSEPPARGNILAGYGETDE